MPPTPRTERPATQPVVGEATPEDEAESEPSPALIEEDAEAPSKPRSRRRRGGRGRRGRGNSGEASLDESDQDESGEAEDQPEASAAADLTETQAPAAPAPPPQDQPLEFAETPREAETQVIPEKPELVAEEPTAPIKIPAKAKAKTPSEPASPEPETPAPSPAPSPRRRRAATEVSEEGEKPVETEGQEAAPVAVKAMKESPPAPDEPVMTSAASQAEPSQVIAKPEPEILAERAKAPAPRKAPKPAVEAEPISPDNMAPALDTPPQAKAEEVKVKSPKASEPAAPKAPKTPKAPKAEPAATEPKVSDKSSGEAGDRD